MDERKKRPGTPDQAALVKKLAVDSVFVVEFFFEFHIRFRFARIEKLAEVGEAEGSGAFQSGFKFRVFRGLDLQHEILFRPAFGAMPETIHKGSFAQEFRSGG